MVPVTAVALLASCSTTEYTYKMYGGAARPIQEVSIVDLGDAVGVKVGDRKVARSDYSRIELLPGTHDIYWECLYGVSVMIEPTGFATGADNANVEFVAGHTYKLHCDRTTGYGYQTYQWITDETTRSIVAGKKKP